MDWIREKFHEINSIKTTLEEIIGIMKGGRKRKKRENDNNNNNNNYKDKDDDHHHKRHTFFSVQQIIDIEHIEHIEHHLWLVTLKNETRDICKNFFVLQGNDIIRFKLDANDIEQIYIVNVTLWDSLIVAKFSSNFYINIYTQHVFNDNKKEIYKVFITKEADVFFQIVLAYQNPKNKSLLPSTFSYIRHSFSLPPLSLQNLLFSTVVHHNLYEGGEIPARILQNCQIFRSIIDEFFAYLRGFDNRGWFFRSLTPRNQNNSGYLYPIMTSNARLLRYFPHIKEMKKFH